jgi:hypothetical protein
MQKISFLLLSHVLFSSYSVVRNLLEEQGGSSEYIPVPVMPGCGFSVVCLLFSGFFSRIKQWKKNGILALFPPPDAIYFIQSKKGVR